MLGTVFRRLRFMKSEFESESPYLARWRTKIPFVQRGSNKFADPTKIKEPENLQNKFYSAAVRLFLFDYLPHLKLIVKRFDRCQDWYQLGVLPAALSLSLLMFNYSLGFKIMTLYLSSVIFLRLLNRTANPLVNEREMYDILYANPDIAALIKPESVYALEYNCEYMKTFPSKEKFPLLHTKVYRFFNCQPDLTEGQYTLGDLDSGAVIVVKFKTMPVVGKYMYSLADFFYFYDLRVEINHNGIFKEIVLRNEEEEIKKHQVFLLYV